MKPDPLHTICVKDDEKSDDEDQKKRKGNCPDNKVLDLKEGPQKPETTANDLKCAIDDEKDCKPPKLPETRQNGKEIDDTFKPKCLDADDNDKTKCDENQQFTEVTVGPDGKGRKTCRPTRQYQNKKKTRMEKLKDKFKKMWDDAKDDRKKKDEERKARKEKIEEEKKKKSKKIEDDKKKKIKSYKCGMATAMVAGQEIAGLKPSKRRLAKREGDGQAHVDSYMDMTACYFDAEFVDSDDFLQYWPADFNVDEIGINVDDKAYMEAFMERMDKADFDFWASHDFCKRDGNGTVEARCPPEKRQEVVSKQVEYEEHRQSAARALKRGFSKPGRPGRRDETLNAENFCDMSNTAKRDTPGTEAVEKRNPFMIFVEIALFAARMAGSLLSRVIPRLASFSPRLSNLLSKTPKNLFKLAPKGQAGNAGSREAMKQAFKKLADHPAFKKCLKDGKP
ncbi:hypothetical protein BCR34DRAFT_606231 [Clohesyomyces aquaticus]|uniref:Uncharacterized protein n=1 Tax=Clohesyomyces aquaticus TaxID=1231657 RepID=A0A1Y1YR88_9PLEO|nr:hypothetical protein BCR34DRAFT_606231 [Clohesyomyces aquaticus]